MGNSYTAATCIERVEIMGEHFTKYHLDNGEVVHHLSKEDAGPPHDHPFPFHSFILVGGYLEMVYELHKDGTHSRSLKARMEGEEHDVTADTIHRILGLPHGGCWTLIQPGPKEKEPGFYSFTPSGIMHRFWYEDAFSLHIAKKTTIA